MTGVEVVHTWSLDAATLRELRELVTGAFREFTDDDWEHALGGVHVLVRESVQRRLIHGERALRTGYVEAVAVRADHRRRGYGRAVMEQVGAVIDGAYELGALSAGEDAARLYRSLGWLRWEGPTWVVTPAGLVRTPGDDDSTYVLPVGPGLDVSGDLACDWREGDVW